MIEQIFLSSAMAIPALVRLFQRKLFPQLPTTLVFLLCCVVAYALLLARVHAVDVRLEAEIHSFDLDGDGAFSEEEMTSDQVRAMEAWSTDTARALAPYSSLILAPLVVAFAFLLVAGVRRCTGSARRLLSRTRS